MKHFITKIPEIELKDDPNYIPFHNKICYQTGDGYTYFYEEIKVPWRIDKKWIISSRHWLKELPTEIKLEDVL